MDHGAEVDAALSWGRHNRFNGKSHVKEVKWIT